MRTRPSGSGFRGQAPGCACRGPRSTCTWSRRAAGCHRRDLLRKNVDRIRFLRRHEREVKGEQVSNSSEWDIERALDAMHEAGLSRRTLVKHAGAGALSLSMIGFLAACGDDDGGSSSEAKVIPKGEIAKNLTFANWPYYMDVKGKRHPTLDK